MSIITNIIAKIKAWAAEKGIDQGIEVGGEYLDKVLHTLYDKKPKTTAIGVIFLESLVTEVLEDFAAKSKTKIDDKLIAEIKEELAAFAAEKGIKFIDLESLVLPEPARGGGSNPEPGGEDDGDGGQG